ncbi:methyltransferase [Rufibacter radiotolerans]|uniref:Methyltransferase n=1 Tax=Rufibacter radiotolerans TaxID=1379910 RepID=A0A0H4VNS9_9BACT|nr:class I SAM-dependent methyltransferase [Rufibacter radiotolerans]AKQ45542.1 methyltransferase [Rufibacter radiotolerans]
MQEFWNNRYKQPDMVYGAKPNEFFRAQLASLKPGALLLAAEGEGRNAVYAAHLGWKVTAFDYSAAGKAKALQLATQEKVTIDYQVKEVKEFEAAPESFDAVALIYAHFPPTLLEAFHQKTVAWLKPGGTLLLEAFHPRQLEYASGGPRDPAMLYSADRLSTDFNGLDIQLLEEEEIYLSEGAFHQGPGFVSRLVATKK